MPLEAAISSWPGPAGALGGLVAEAALGYPAALHRRLPHPVVWIGGAISALELCWNKAGRSAAMRRTLGAATMVLVAGAAGLAGWLLQGVFEGRPFGLVAFALAASVGLAQRSLYDHVAAVRAALDAGDLPAGRKAVGMIVGRDVEQLGAGQVAAAALESLAESFNDGVVAPAFWLALGGLPGLFVYKAVNTGDSLIGHRELRWRAFGWAAARADDLMNLIPARLAGLMICLAAAGGLKVMLRDARRHASPNAGWPEAAMAGALKVRLGGPARYDGALVERPRFGDGRPPQASDLGRGLRLYLKGCALLWILMAAGALAWPR
ncbi:MAG TPA: adenosylcobinamide-phosphate synthase CbiB [Phenylobacterium sp.]|uniref:adenosylcobinamide-phosphate synthase CbiB n=1 Tax=Phenylobacterium sp. TaxID=1871053 RepID=UPI002B4977E7|nr:adenosylcobinamide-phosphate synthase CbiB [Phenylobacterium sp.]HKR86554.1 adenosylcobinamide-phosphate synthase CbiB [Phenylobacterium sp.]